EIDDLESSALEHHRDQVLADVVNVPLDRPDDDLADRLDTGFRQQGAQDFHATLHGVRRQQHLGHEQYAVSKIDSDDAHALHQRVVEHAFSRPASLEENTRGFFDLGLEAVV